MTTSDAAARAVASAAAKNSEERLRGAAGPVELDEFGRDVSMEANAEESKRIERREARDHRWKVSAFFQTPYFQTSVMNEYIQQWHYLNNSAQHSL